MTGHQKKSLQEILDIHNELSHRPRIPPILRKPAVVVLLAILFGFLVAALCTWWPSY